MKNMLMKKFNLSYILTLLCMINPLMGMTALVQRTAFQSTRTIRPRVAFHIQKRTMIIAGQAAAGGVSAMAGVMGGTAALVYHLKTKQKAPTTGTGYGDNKNYKPTKVDQDEEQKKLINLMWFAKTIDSPAISNPHSTQPSSVPSTAPKESLKTCGTGKIATNVAPMPCSGGQKQSKSNVDIKMCATAAGGLAVSGGVALSSTGVAIAVPVAGIAIAATSYIIHTACENARDDDPKDYERGGRYWDEDRCDRSKWKTASKERLALFEANGNRTTEENRRVISDEELHKNFEELKKKGYQWDKESEKYKAKDSNHPPIKDIVYIEKDYLHNHIEVYDENDNHLGWMDPITKEIHPKSSVDTRKAKNQK